MFNEVPMYKKIVMSIVFWLCLVSIAVALEPDNVLVLVNADMNESVELGQYYCRWRNVPRENLLEISLGKTLRTMISRAAYDSKIAPAVRKKIDQLRSDHPIRCILTTYGVPYRVSGRGMLQTYKRSLATLKDRISQIENRIESVKLRNPKSPQVPTLERQLRILQSQSDYITGRLTDAALDSELAMLMADSYELFRFQDNRLKGRDKPDGLTVMVCRIDGPGVEIARLLIDKAITAERNGLTGKMVIDARGKTQQSSESLFYIYDQALLNLAQWAKDGRWPQVMVDKTEALFQPRSCPNTALYCGWYSLKNYIDAFDFVDGAIGYHIASWEAIDLRDPNSTQWCPAMLKDGITATIGAVAEPYLTAFPMPDEFFKALFDGKTLVEAYFYTNPYNSWQMMLIGDPLYRPFAKN